MQVADLGEFGLIDRLAGALREAGAASAAPSDDLLVGIGDDAAAWRSSRSIEVATTDTMVDGIHFVAERVDPNDIGWKALAVNVSDIGAMGVRPVLALVTIGLPTDTKVGFVDSLYEGIAACAVRYGLAVAGGDIVRSPTMFVSVTALGRTAWRSNWRKQLLLRSAARPGDVVAVTGTLGGSAGGLEIILGRRWAAEPEASALLGAHDRPAPPVELGARLVELGVRCGMDLSDGLAGDLAKICQASAVGAKIDLARLPVHPALINAWPADASRVAAVGGEDYELLFAARPAVWRRCLADGVPATAIGRIVEGEPKVDFSGFAGARLSGWDHLAENA